MTDPMHLQPQLPEYRYALYCRSDLFGLCESPQQPIALYRDEELAVAHGKCMWPTAYRVVDLHGEERPCAKPN